MSRHANRPADRAADRAADRSASNFSVANRLFDALEERRLLSWACFDSSATMLLDHTLDNTSPAIEMPATNDRAGTLLPSMSRGYIPWSGVTGEWKGTVRVGMAGHAVKVPVQFDLMPRSSNTVRASLTVAGRTIAGTMKLSGTNSSFTATYSKSGVTAKISGGADSTLEHIKGTMRAAFGGNVISGKLAADRVF